jgi:chromosome segregation ATPase
MMPIVKKKDYHAALVASLTEAQAEIERLRVLNQSLEADIGRKRRETSAEIEQLQDAQKYLGFEVDRHIDEIERLRADFNDCNIERARWRAEHDEWRHEAELRRDERDELLAALRVARNCDLPAKAWDAVNAAIAKAEGGKCDRPG